MIIKQLFEGVSAGELQGLIFNKDHPEYLNYGGLGFSVARDITQGFNWWESDNDNLDTIKCFIDRYSDFNIPEVNKTVLKILSKPFCQLLSFLLF